MCVSISRSVLVLESSVQNDNANVAVGSRHHFGDVFISVIL